MNAGMGGTGGGGDATTKLGGGERQRENWVGLRLVVRVGEGERVGGDDNDE